ncbi:hypothetical protein AB0M44_31015 [Streptosporangium subroseum]|uniref:hypothetical protein n=1 Tax=Streptosporangium subroseum TaxID=106412 RepID=UPI00342F06D6
MEQPTTAQDLPQEPKIYGYELQRVWQATYVGELTEEAKLAGCEAVLVDSDLTRLRMKAMINRAKACTHESEPEEDDPGQ